MGARQVARLKQPAATRGRRPGAFHTSRRATTATRAGTAPTLPAARLRPANGAAPPHPHAFSPSPLAHISPPPANSTRAHGEAPPSHPPVGFALGAVGKSNSPGRGETKHPKSPSLVLRLPACLPALRASLHARSQKIQKRKPVTWLRLIAPDRLLAFPSALRPPPLHPRLPRSSSCSAPWAGKSFLVALLVAAAEGGRGRNRGA